jgi:hypothetical protein
MESIESIDVAMNLAETSAGSAETMESSIDVSSNEETTT